MKIKNGDTQIIPANIDESQTIEDIIEKMFENFMHQIFDVVIKNYNGEKEAYFERKVSEIFASKKPVEFKIDSLDDIKKISL